MELLDGITPDKIRACGVRALQSLRKQSAATWMRVADAVDRVDTSSRDTFVLHNFGRELVKLLDPCGTERATQLGEVFLDDDAMGMEWMSNVLEFLWWLIRAGLAIELRREVDTRTTIPGQEHGHTTHRYPIEFRLTARGVRFLDDTQNDADNPMLPGFLDRIGLRCPGIPESVVALLVDARACFDHSLMRPAVVLMGVAYEVAIERVVEELVSKHFLEAKDRETAKDRIKRINTLLNSDIAKKACPNSDARTLAEEAYRFAEQLRQRRNDAAHTKPAFDFTHTPETEEYFVSAGRFLPGIWSLATWDTL